jgi:hypothetical protein
MHVPKQFYRGLAWNFPCALAMYMTPRRMYILLRPLAGEKNETCDVVTSARNGEDKKKKKEKEK